MAEVGFNLEEATAKLLKEDYDVKPLTEEPPFPNFSKKKTTKKEEDNIIYISYIETEKYILEQVRNATLANDATHTVKGKFVQFDKELGTTDEIDEFQYENRVYRPITSSLTDKNMILLPTGVEEYGTTKKLATEIKTFFNEYFEPPNFFENFLPYLVLFYWVYDKFPFVPYVHFVGRTSTGKTTAMEVFGSICYKPIDVSSSITMASMFRVASEWRGTLLIDEFDMAGDGYRAMLAFLKSGVSDRAVLRVEGEKKKEVIAFAVKSPKIFTSENPVTTAGFQSRTILIKMEKNKRRLPLYRLKGFVEEAERLRNKLLLWRLRNINEIKLKEIEFGFDELAIFDRRVQQVITPVFYLSDNESKEDILGFAEEHQRETLRERRESLDGITFEVMCEFIENGADLELSKILDEVNKRNTGYKETTARKLGNVIRKKLNFEIDRVGHENTSTVIIRGQEEKIKELSDYYGIPTSSTSVANVASDADEPEVVKTAKELFNT